MSDFAASPTRQRFLSRFERHGEGYLYDRGPHTLPVHISIKDHEFIIDAFDTDWLRLPLVATFSAAILALFLFLGLTQSKGLNSLNFKDMSFLAAALWFPGAWYADLWEIGDRALFQRARDMGRTKSLPWLTRSAGDCTWRSMTIFVFWGPHLADRIFSDGSTKLWDWFSFGVFVLAIALCVAIVARKTQLNKTRSLPYLNEVH